MKRTRIRDRVIAEMRRCPFITYDELIRRVEPLPDCASARIRDLRRAAMIKNIERARVELSRQGFLLANVPLPGRQWALRLIELPANQCDPQTMAELTLGRQA